MISALDSPHHPTLSLQSWYQAILNWNITSDIRAPIIALDPPPQGPGLQAKYVPFDYVLLLPGPHLYYCTVLLLKTLDYE